MSITLVPWMRVGDYELIHPLRRIYPGAAAQWRVQCVRCGERTRLALRLLCSRAYSGIPLVCESQVCRGQRVYSPAFRQRLAELRAKRVPGPSATRTKTQQFGDGGAALQASTERYEWDLACSFADQYPEPDDTAAHELLSRGPNPARQW